MKTIKERANFAAWQIWEDTDLSEHSIERVAEIIAEKIHEQKAIDGEEINALYSIMEQSASVLGIGTMWLNENARQVAIAELREKILKYFKEYT